MFDPTTDRMANGQHTAMKNIDALDSPFWLSRIGIERRIPHAPKEARDPDEVTHNRLYGDPERNSATRETWVPQSGY